MVIDMKEKTPLPKKTSTPLKSTQEKLFYSAQNEMLSGKNVPKKPQGKLAMTIKQMAAQEKEHWIDMKKIVFVFIFIFIFIFPILSHAAFDILGYKKANEEYYGDMPLADIARDVYEKDFKDQAPDFDTWKKNVGIEQIIREDTERRALMQNNQSQNIAESENPAERNKSREWLIAGTTVAILAIIIVVVLASLRNAARGGDEWKKYWIYITAALIIIIIASIFRYETEQVGARLIRHDRLTSSVEYKSVFSNNDKWIPLRYKNLQQAKAVFQKRDMEAAAAKASAHNEEQSEELERMNRNIEDLKRENQFRELQRQNEERIREMNRQQEELQRQIQQRRN